MEKLVIQEVGLRDGLQLESRFLDTDTKWTLASMLADAGINRMELSSFVSPRAVPQMADAAELFARRGARKDTRHIALVVNEKGYDRAVAAGADSVAAVLIPTETLSMRNSRKTVKEALGFVEWLAERAAADGVWTRVYLSVAWVCPFEGAVPAGRILDMAKRVDGWGTEEIALADTIGHAHPLEVGRLCETVGEAVGMQKVAVHLHDTLALGLANAAAAIAAGVRVVDSSVGGLGGCPFAPGSRGNLATEDLLLMAEKMGLETGVSIDGVYAAVRYVEGALGRPLGGRTRSWWKQNSMEQKSAK